MNWKKVKIANFLKERLGRYKPDEANLMGLKRIEKIDFSGIYHLVDKSTNTDMILVKNGDLLISGINAEKGAITIYNDEADALATIHYSAYEFDKSKINIEYFKLFLISNAFKTLLKASAGGGIKTELKAKHLLPLEIFLPSLQKQIEIVSNINKKKHKHSAITIELNHQQAYLRLLRQTILQEAVQGKLTKQDPTDEPATELLKRIKSEKEKLIKAGKLKKEKELPIITGDEEPFELPEGWVWCRLGEIAISSEAGKSFQCSDRSIKGSEYGIIKMSAISSGVFKELENKFFQEAYSDKQGHRIKPGDLLFARASGSRDLTGISCVVETINSNLLLNDKSIRFQFSNSINVNFINYWNNSSFGRIYYGVIMGTKTTTMNNITRDQFNNLITPLPPLSEQHRITKKNQEFQKQLNNLEIQIEQSREYTQQLLQTILKEVFEQNDIVNATNHDLSIAPKQEVLYEISKIDHYSPDKLHAMLLAKIIETHNQQPKYLPTLGRVKSEKTCHIIENQLEIDLGREPLKDAAGPVDFPHVLEVERLAHKQQWFTAKQKKVKGKVDFIKGKHFNQSLKLASETFKEKEESIDRIINLFLPLDTEQIEIVATSYAAWNNLLLIQASFTDEDIITEARENWTEEKLRYSRLKFQYAIDWLRINQLVPAGKGKLVLPK